MNYLTILIRQTLLIALFTSFSFYSYGSNLNGKILDVQDDARLYCNTDCELNFFLRIKMAQAINASLDDLVPMYLAYSLDNESYEMHSVDLTKFLDYGNSVNDQPILEYRVYFSIDVSNLDQDELPTDYDLGLFTDYSSSNNGYFPYPVLNYKEEESFFPCNIFDLSFGQQVPSPGCDISREVNPFYSGDFQIHCKPCFDQEPGTPKGGYLDLKPLDLNPFEKEPFNKNGDELPFYSEQENLSRLQFYPNPFNTQLLVPFQLEKTAKVALQIFDATGKIMYQESNLKDAGFHQIELNTDTWPAGVYYAKTQSGNTTQSYRLVKID